MNQSCSVMEKAQVKNKGNGLNISKPLDGAQSSSSARIYFERAEQELCAPQVFS